MMDLVEDSNSAAPDTSIDNEENGGIRNVLEPGQVIKGMFHRTYNLSIVLILLTLEFLSGFPSR